MRFLQLKAIFKILTVFLRISRMFIKQVSNSVRMRFVRPMAMAAAAAGADGLMIEVHDHPEQALCDGQQSLNPEQFDVLAEDVRRILPFACRYSL